MICMQQARRKTHESANPSSKKDEESKAVKEGALMSTEEKNEGDVPMATYWAFIKAGGKWAFFFTILTQLCSQALQVEANFWLVDWGKDTIMYEISGEKMPMKASMHWYRGYAGMLMAGVFFNTLSRGILTYHRTNASLNLHTKIIDRVMLFPVAFFDVTPIGRIINRFSQDMATIDEDLANSLSQVIGMGGSVLGSIGGVAGSTQGTFLALLVPLGYLYRVFNIYYPCLWTKCTLCSHLGGLREPQHSSRSTAAGSFSVAEHPLGFPWRCGDVLHGCAGSDFVQQRFHLSRIHCARIVLLYPDDVHVEDGGARDCHVGGAVQLCRACVPLLEQHPH